MITYADLLRKLYQKKRKNRFMHKTKYGRSLGEDWGYDFKAHQEEYNRIKNDPDKLFKDYFVS